ncbi:S26 family signal peptidase [bacterium]|nr:S26 family signal peptidase [bacterium]
MSTTIKKKNDNAVGKSTGSVDRGEPKLGDLIHIIDDPRVRREYFEMVIFVLVLVCFLRQFGAEAYVIPSGSMAPTLMGANKVGICPECGQVSFVNARDEAEDGRVVVEGLCQNCQHPLEFNRGGFSSGDRVLVDKLEYQRNDGPKPWDVAVFKFPDGVRYDPNGQVRSARTNYIKRVVGRPNQSIGIEFGDVFIKDNGKGEKEFTVLRKPERAVIATRRLVWDNDKQPKDLVAEGFPSRWAPAADSPFKPSADNKSFSLEEPKSGFIEYHHILRPRSQVSKDNPTPSLISDFEAYNTDNFHHEGSAALGENWVGDLMIETTVELTKGEGAAVIELNKGRKTYRAELDVKSQQVKLYDGPKEVAAKAASLALGSRYRVRFSDFDDRLFLWINGSSIFENGIDVPSPTRDERGPFASDLNPVRMGTKDLAAKYSGIKLYRDIYYTKGGRNIRGDVDLSRFASVNTPQEIDSHRNYLLSGKMRTFQTKADQFFVLGDNSTHSADARDWDKVQHVDRGLLLGRAVVRYWPVVRFEGSWPVLEWKFVE